MWKCKNTPFSSFQHPNIKPKSRKTYVGMTWALNNGPPHGRRVSQPQLWSHSYTLRFMQLHMKPNRSLKIPEKNHLRSRTQNSLRCPADGETYSETGEKVSTSTESVLWLPNDDADEAGVDRPPPPSSSLSDKSR